MISRADQTAVDWFSGTPSFQKEIDHPVLPAISNYNGCTKATVQVVRSLVSAPFEEHCLVPTAMGLVRQLYRNEGVVQPVGYGKAYPVGFIAGGNPIAYPVPNQASAIHTSPYSQGAGTVYGYYSQLSNHMKIKIDASGIKYEIAGQDLAVDHSFKHANGSTAPFNSATQSFSSNGRYMIVDTLSAGFARISLSSLKIQPFASTLIKANGSSLLGAATAIDDTGRLAVIAYNAPGDWGSKYLKLVDIDTCGAAESTEVPIQSSYNCQTVDLLPKLKQALPTVKYVGNVRFVNDRTITFVVIYTNQAGVDKYATYSMTAFGQSKSLKQYLALGDSYISGEGAYSYREGTDTQRNQCHQSLLSYPYLLSSNFNSFASVACSGAKTNHIQKLGNQKSYQLIGEEPSQQQEAEALALYTPGVNIQETFIRKDNPEAITISIGGNDIGFGQILEKCVHPLKHLQENVESGFTCYDTYEDRLEVINTINGQFTRLRSLYEAMRDNGTGGRRVYVIGYPQIAKVGGDCGLNVQMNAEEIEFAHELIVHLNSVIKRAANEAGVLYVNTEQAFDGHRLCEASAGQYAVNGFTISKNPAGGRDFKASFHPNKLGHEKLAATIAAQTDSLTKPMPGASTKTNQVSVDPNATVLQGVPKTNRTIRQIHTAGDLTSSIMDRGGLLNFVLNSQEYLTKPGAAYSLTIGTASVGSYIADTTGSVQVSSAIPADTAPGFHTMHIYGNDAFGNLIDIQQVIFVTASAEDSDGDGIANEADSCELAAQSGVDVDQDNTDDVCDVLIDLPIVTPPSEPAGIIWHDKAIMPISIQIQAVSGP